MDRLLPIIPDCICIVIIPPNIGKELTAVQRLDSDRWAVRAPWLDTSDGRGSCALETSIIRKDGQNDQDSHADKDRPVENVA